MALLESIEPERWWIVWGFRPGPDGHPTKVPLHPVLLYPIDAHNRDHWMQGAEAAMHAQRLGPQYGRALVMHEQMQMVALDLDKCLVGPQWALHAVKIMTICAGAYIEISPSRKGIRILFRVRGPVPPHARQVTVDGFKCEMYHRRQFVTVTGFDARGSVDFDGTDILPRLIAEYFPAPVEQDSPVAGWTEAPAASWEGPVSDIELLRLASKSKPVLTNRATFAELWEGTADILGELYPDPDGHDPYDRSRVEQALCNHLAFWTGSDCERMERIMRRSPHARAKWETNRGYLRGTILKAATGCKTHYRAKGAPPLASAVPAPPPAAAAPVSTVPPPPPGAMTTIPPPPVAPPLSVTPEGPIEALSPGQQGIVPLDWDAPAPKEYRAGKIVPTMRFVEYALRTSPDFTLVHDTYLHTNLIRWKDSPRFELIDDETISRFMMYFNEWFAAEEPSRQYLRDAIEVSCKARRVDSHAEWVKAQMWDGKPRVDRFLVDYCGAADTEYSRAVGRYIWSALAGRALSPGCQADMAVAFISPQGRYKSSAIAAMAPNLSHFSNTANPADTTDNFKRLLVGKCVVEIPEMRGMSKADVGHVKEAITRRCEEWIEKFKVYKTFYPRRNLFFATTNHTDFLPKDETGNRRWLPVEIERMNAAAIERDRAQLWAEGKAMYMIEGIQWADAERLAAQILPDYEERDIWEERIAEWLEQRTAQGPIQTREIAEDCLRLGADKQNPVVSQRINRALRQLGYKQANRRVAGRQSKVWCKD